MEKQSPDDFAKALATVFRKAREKSGLSQKKLSEISKVGRTGIVTFEAGNRIPSILICKMLAGGLGRSLSSLVEDAENHTGRTQPKSIVSDLES